MYTSACIANSLRMVNKINQTGAIAEFIFLFYVDPHLGVFFIFKFLLS